MKNNIMCLGVCLLFVVLGASMNKDRGVVIKTRSQKVSTMAVTNHTRDGVNTYKVANSN